MGTTTIPAKLSDLIERGYSEGNLKFVRGTFFDSIVGQIYACPLGAAAVAAKGLLGIDDLLDFTDTKARELLESATGFDIWDRRIPGPTDKTQMLSLLAFVIAATDNWDWPLERIIEYLREHGY